jgi:hypothetical protein
MGNYSLEGVTTKSRLRNVRVIFARTQQTLTAAIVSSVGHAISKQNHETYLSPLYGASGLRLAAKILGYSMLGAYGYNAPP